MAGSEVFPSGGDEERTTAPPDSATTPPEILADTARTGADRIEPIISAEADFYMTQTRTLQGRPFFHEW